MTMQQRFATVTSTARQPLLKPVAPSIKTSLMPVQAPLAQTPPITSYQLSGYLSNQRAASSPTTNPALNQRYGVARPSAPSTAQAQQNYAPYNSFIPQNYSAADHQGRAPDLTYAGTPYQTIPGQTPLTYGLGQNPYFYGANAGYNPYGISSPQYQGTGNVDVASLVNRFPSFLGSPQNTSGSSSSGGGNGEVAFAANPFGGSSQSQPLTSAGSAMRSAKIIIGSGTGGSSVPNFYIGPTMPTPTDTVATPDGRLLPNYDGQAYANPDYYNRYPNASQYGVNYPGQIPNTPGNPYSAQGASNYSNIAQDSFIFGNQNNAQPNYSVASGGNNMGSPGINYLNGPNPNSMQFLGGQDITQNYLNPGFQNASLLSSSAYSPSQSQMLDDLYAATQGKTPSAAQLQAQQSADLTGKQGLALLAAHAGPSPGTSLYNAMQNQTAAGLAGGAQAAALRAQEMAAARQLYSASLGQAQQQEVARRAQATDLQKYLLGEGFRIPELQMQGQTNAANLADTQAARQNATRETELQGDLGRRTEVTLAAMGIDANTRNTIIDAIAKGGSAALSAILPFLGGLAGGGGGGGSGGGSSNYNNYSGVSVGPGTGGSGYNAGGPSGPLPELSPTPSAPGDYGSTGGGESTLALTMRKLMGGQPSANAGFRRIG
jgi:hypothetical protein